MLNRFNRLQGTLALVCGLSFFAVTPQARATFPTVVASSTTVIVNSNSFGYLTKVVTDPSGNIFMTDSSGLGALWEVPVGTSTVVRVTSFVYFASVTNGGAGYTSAPTVTFSAPATGTNVATGVAIVSGGVVKSITMTNQGSGYTAAPSVSLSGGGFTTAATATASISLNASHGITVDKYGDVIVVNANTSGSNIYFLPYVNGHLSTTSNAAGTEPLDLFSAYGIAPTLDNYYGVVSDVAIDKSGNLYVAMKTCSTTGGTACAASQDSIFLIKNITNTTTAATIATANTATLFIGQLGGGNNKPAINIAVDNNGHLFYVDGTNAYMTSTTSGANPSSTILGKGFVAPSGISVDAGGNVFIVDNSTKLLTEIPNENGTLNPADQFVVASMTNPYYSVGFDPVGNVIQADGSDKNLNRITLGALNVGTVAVGAPVPATATMNFRFNTVGTAMVTPTAVSVLQGTSGSAEFQNTPATTCSTTTAYANGGSCAVTVSFSPSSTGLRRGGIVLVGAGNKALATGYLSGTGTGAGLTADPGTQTALTAKSAWVTPGAVALDAAGNRYVADTGANTVQVISASGAATASIGSGLSAPGGVTVDGAGNVYISDTGNNRVVEVPNENGTLNTADQFTVLPSASGLLPSTVNSTGATVFNGLNKPLGIFAGADGGLYVTDAGNRRVLRYQTFDGLSSLVQTTVGSGYSSPVAVTTDGNGNVYVADQAARQIDEINLQTGSQAVVLSAGLSAPASLALDASGALYVLDTSAQAVFRYTNVAGAYQSASVLTLGTALSSPQGVAVNGAGNAVVTDDGAAAIGTVGQPGYIAAVAPTAYSLVRTAGTLNFGNVNNGQPSTQAVTLTSMGSATATLGTPAYAQTGATADYTVANGTCANGASLTVGSSCTYSATLSPVVTSGTLTDVLTFSSNAVNGPSISETLTGVATNLALTTTTLQLNTSASPVYGQAVTVAATVASQRAGVYPTGYVTFSLDGTNQKPLVLLPSNCSASVVCTATYTFNALTLSAATHAINARYSGDTANAASEATTALIVTVAKQPTVTADVLSAVQTAPVAPVIALVPGSTFYFNVAVGPTIATTPPGVPSGSAYLVAAGSTTPITGTTVLLTGSSTGQIAYAPPGAPGSYSYQVVYSGDSNFAASVSGAVTVQLVNPTYTVAIPSTNYNVVGGNSVTFPITVTSIGNYAGNVTVGGVNVTTGAITPACTGLPQYVTCTFSPGIVALGPPPTGNGNYPISNAVEVMNLTLSTNVPPAAPYGQGGLVLWPAATAGMLALALAYRKRRNLFARRVLLAAVAMVLGGLTMSLSGCGSGRGPSAAYVSPKGAGNITVNFSGSPVGGYPVGGTPPPGTNPANIPNTTTFQLTVQ